MSISNDLFDRLHDLQIAAETADYPEHRTVEEGKARRGDLAGTFTKNLLLKDKKGRSFLVVAHEDTAVALKTLHTHIGAQGRLGFASPELMQRYLGVSPGTVTPLAVINDAARAVTVVIESALVSADQLNFHPMNHTQTMGLSPADLFRFLRSCDHEPVIADLSD